MKIKYSTIIKSIPGVENMCNLEVSYSTYLKLSKNMKQLRSIAEDYENERIKLLECYVEKAEDGSYVFLDEEKKMLKLKKDMVEEFYKKEKELNDFEVEVNLYLLDASDFEGIKVKTSDLMYVDYMMKEDE